MAGYRPGFLPVMMFCHLVVVGPMGLSHLVLVLRKVPAVGDQFRRRVLRVLGVGRFGRRERIVEIIANAVARENLRRHHLRMDDSLPVAQHESVPAVRLRPELGIGNCDRQARSPRRAAESEGMNAFRSDHARVWARARTLLDDDALERATGQQQ